MKRLFGLFALLLAVFATPVLAAEPYTKAAFMKAQDMGQPILLHVHAPWCPTCKAQEPTVAAIEKENMALKVFRVDFDSQKDVLKELGVKEQSTLITYHGKMETGRVTGETDPMKIHALVAQATMSAPMMPAPMMSAPMMDKKM